MSQYRIDSISLNIKTPVPSLIKEVVSVEKNVCIREEEVLLVNGTPITLEGEEGRAIKECLLKGTIPNQDLINHLLLKVACSQFYCMLSRSGSRDPISFGRIQIRVRIFFFLNLVGLNFVGWLFYIKNEFAQA